MLNVSLTVDEITQLENKYREIEETEYFDLFNTEKQENLTTYFAPLIRQAKIMIKKYDIVCTNPPYMGGSSFNPNLIDKVKNIYPDSKSDLFAVFMEKCNDYTKPKCYTAMITMHSWMFLSSFEKLRKKVECNTTISMAHFGARAFDEISGEVVQTTAFVTQKEHIPNYNGIYKRLITPKNEAEKKEALLSKDYDYVANSDNFSKIPSSPVAYWVSEKFIQNFNLPKLGNIAKPRQGMATSDNNRFLRIWFEVSRSQINFYAISSQSALKKKKKWFPYNKGGNYRKWYGNNEYVVNWENDGKEIKQLAVKLYKCVTRTIKNIQFYFQEGITWTTLSSGSLSARYSPTGFLFDTKGSTCYFDDSNLIDYILAFTNSKVADLLLQVLAPTLDYNCGSIAKIPVAIDNIKKAKIDELVQNNIDNSKRDWDSFETSWDFERSPLI